MRATVRSTVRRWVPDHPVAWVTATAPALAGLVAGTEYGRPTVAAFWLLACWVLCYCVQFTVVRWLRSGFARRYRNPVLVYCAALAAVGVPFVVLHPGVLAWAPAFAALIAASFVAAYRRRDRSLWAKGMVVAASSLMPSLTYAYGMLGSGAGAGAGIGGIAGAASAVSLGDWTSSIPPMSDMGMALFRYFFVTQFGSVLFAGTMSGSGGGRRRLAVSWAWHAAFVVWSVLGPLLGLGPDSSLGSQAGPWIVAVALLLLARAVVLPLLGRLRPIRPLVTGAVEGVSGLVSFAGSMGLVLASA
ncbi:YwiC-like protein [Bifidobacterium sp. DSM 109958]|uniref:YwiC-like protein n=2 Tax=Bifidobacterium moraviense TaxID=2675323 RepID=A0A7Y0HYC5_9BIFI|nr:YwiC-like protein [Bifidobacterium sp. DSM 109958]